MTQLDPQFWEDKYAIKDTPWDLGMASPALIKYFTKIEDKEVRILIPGGGRAYELSALHKMGFKQAYLCDWSPTAIAEAKKINPMVNASHFLCANFFDLIDEYDLIIEQTFMCALDPMLREDYVDKCYDLLKNRNGRLAGLLFDVEFEKEGPPFGGSKAEYEKLFGRRFDILSLESTQDSIQPRLGNEVFIEVKATSDT